MFSFIKSFQEFLAKLRSNKKYWFTTISVVSITGIFLSIFFLTTLTSGVAKEVYAAMSESYKLKVETKTENKKNEFKKIALSLQNNDAIKGAMTRNDSAALVEFARIQNESFGANNMQALAVEFHVQTGDGQVALRNSVNAVFNSKNPLFGLEVTQDGVFYVLLQPVLEGENIVGVIEVRDSVHSLRNNFESEGGEYVFLLDKKMLEVLSLKAKSGRYKDAAGDYKVEQAAYDTKFNGSLSDLDSEEFKEFLEKSIFITDDFYRTYKKATDINGADIGLIIVGEAIDKKGGVVNLADSMSKQVTAIALGLVISIMLFMF